ncbi:MAG: DUF4402 domain-containing protein [Bacteroidales bacterium]|nr:DUF4402 domain-containing protein [Bacteroidales bacterium]
MEVTTQTPFNFGSFALNGNGSVTLNYDDSRSKTGEIQLMGVDYNAATMILTITAERTINVYFPENQYLTREGGTETIPVTLGPTDKGLSFPASALPLENTIDIGGTLDLAGPLANPAGTYSGQVEIEFTIVYE